MIKTTDIAQINLNVLTLVIAIKSIKDGVSTLKQKPVTMDNGAGPSQAKQSCLNNSVSKNTATDPANPACEAEYMSEDEDCEKIDDYMASKEKKDIIVHC